MKRIVASLGVVAIGAACVDSTQAQGVGGDGSKPWSVSVALRGFYDDNVRTAHEGVTKIEAFGFEVSPSLGATWELDQTTLSLAYTYAFRYYDKRPEAGYGHDDQTHTIAARMMHSFSERTTLSVSDSFVIGQEPDVLRTGNSYTSYQSLSGNNIRNYGNINLNHQFAPKFGVEVGYANALFDYEGRGATIGFTDDDPDAVPPGNYPTGVAFSRSGLLDRMEHAFHADARWTVQSTTIALVGYQYGFTRFNGDEPIGIVNTVDVGNIAHNVVVSSSIRDSQSHYGYVGIEHSFRPDLQASARVGARFTKYDNSPSDESNVSPYASGSLRYMYARDSNLAVGVSHDRSATDAISTLGGSVTSDMENTIAYGSITHRILPALFGTLMGQYQNSSFSGGSLDGVTEDYFLASLNLEYRINRHVSANVSYHYDLLDSPSPVAIRGFDRNRVFVGATFTY